MRLLIIGAHPDDADTAGVVLELVGVRLELPANGWIRRYRARVHGTVAMGEGKPITPDEWAHIRSIAKWVLPVFVGPRIARTGASERRAIALNVAAFRTRARFLSSQF